MSDALLLSQLPFATSTSSSSFTLPSTTTPEHALQSGQHDLLQEHPVHRAHRAHLHALPFDKQRHQESFWRENLQSGGNPAHHNSHIFSGGLEKDALNLFGVCLYLVSRTGTGDG